MTKLRTPFVGSGRVVMINIGRSIGKEKSVSLSLNLKED
jgi:hypothetical protein